MQKAIPIKTFIDNVTDSPGTGELKHDGIDERDVIRQKEKTAGRKLFAADRRHPIDDFRDR
jgi:hypothetical protein